MVSEYYLQISNFCDFASWEKNGWMDGWMDGERPLLLLFHEAIKIYYSLLYFVILFIKLTAQFVSTLSLSNLVLVWCIATCDG